MNPGTFKPVRIGVVGVGNFGRLHVLTLAGLFEAELVAIVDKNEEALTHVRSDLPQVSAWSDLDRALNEAGAEAWIIATNTESHVPLAEKLLTAGCKVLIEKPLSESYDTAKRLETLVSPNSKDIMLGHILLFAPENRQLLNEVHTRGHPAYFHAARHRLASTWDRYLENPIRMLMIHDLYVAYSFMDGEEPTSMSARLHQRDDGGYDLARAEMEWKNGTWGSFTASYLTTPGMSTEGFDRLEVFGKGWVARLELVPQPIEIWTDRAEWPLGLDVFADPNAPSGWLADELRHFCRVVRGQAKVPLGANFSDALAIQRWVEQLEKSTQMTF